MKTAKFQCVEMLPAQYSTEDGGVKATKKRCTKTVDVEGTFCQAHSHQGALGSVDYTPLYGAVIDDILMTADQAQAYLKAKKGNKAPKTMTSSKTTKKETTVKTNEKKEEGIMFTLLYWMIYMINQMEVAKDGRLYTHNESGKSVFVKKAFLKGNNLEALVHAIKGFGGEFTAEVETIEIKEEEKVDTNVPCPACKGSGRWIAQTGWVGPCHRCESKGFQTPSDVARNKAYDTRSTGNLVSGTRDPNTRYVVFTAHGLKNGRIEAIKVLPLRPENNLLATATLLQRLYGADRVPTDAKFIWILDGNTPFKLLVKGNGRSWANYTARPLPEHVSF